MGRFVRERDGRSFLLFARTMVGRGASATIVVDDPYASSEHARIRWTGTRWEIGDLGSKNGTFLDGQALKPGQSQTLSPGSVVGFGEVSGWTLADASGPGPAAVDLQSGEVVSGGAELLALPSEEDAVATVYLTDQIGRWALEQEDEVGDVQHGQVVQVAGRSFRLELPEPSHATPTLETSFAFPNVTFMFEVPRNEENAHLALRFRTDLVPLEPREYHYLLMTLARARQEDAELPEPERGWRSNRDLSKMLNIDPQLLNVWIHRARRQLESVGLEGAVKVVDVRRGYKRFGTARFSLRTAES